MVYKAYYNDDGQITHVEIHNNVLSEGRYILTSMDPVRLLTSTVVDNQIYTDIQQGIRLVRNKKLKETDWTQAPDSPVNKDSWATYRQQLRDVPQQDNFPDLIVWPTPPAE